MMAAFDAQDIKNAPATRYKGQQVQRRDDFNEIGLAVLVSYQQMLCAEEKQYEMHALIVCAGHRCSKRCERIH